MGRMVANQGNGQCISTADPLTCTPLPNDIVLVLSPPGPPVPVPCVNTALLADATGTIDSVRINSKAVVVMPSVIPKSLGAPPNAIMGIASPPPANNRCNFTTASATVFANGKPLVRHRDTTAQNAGNCVGAVKLTEAFTLGGSGIEIDSNMTPAQREQIMKQLESLYERPRTRELLNTLRADYQGRIAAGNPANLITVSANTASGVPCAALDAGQLPLGLPANDFNNVGNPSWVQFDPQQSVNLAGYAETMTPDLVLAHELVHAMHSARGTTLAGSSVGTLPNGNPASSAMMNWEQQAMGIGTESNSRLAESRFAEERGMQVRRTHGPSEGEFPHNPNAANVAPVGFATGAGGEYFVYCNK